MKKVLILTTSEGHRSIAEAIQDWLSKENEYQSTVCFIEEKGLVFYKFFYRYFPQLFGFIYTLSFTKLVQLLLPRFLNLEHDRVILEEVSSFKPDIIINTSFGFTPSIERLKSPSHPYTFVNVIPNPRTFFRQDIASAADLNLVFDEYVEKKVQQLQKSVQVQKVGWFVRDAFVPKDKVTAKTQLNLNPDTFTLLFVAGSEGISTILDVLPILFEVEQPLQVLVACGHNQRLIKKIRALKAPSHIKIKPFGFTDRIYAYMQAADLVIGKAGPNMLFEAVATHTPFFATAHIAGLENGNLEIISEYNLGFVQEQKKEIGSLLKKIIKKPSILQDTIASIKKLARHNNQAGEKLSRILGDISTST